MFEDSFPFTKKILKRRKANRNQLTLTNIADLHQSMYREGIQSAQSQVSKLTTLSWILTLAEHWKCLPGLEAKQTEDLQHNPERTRKYLEFSHHIPVL